MLLILLLTILTYIIVASSYKSYKYIDNLLRYKTIYNININNRQTSLLYAGFGNKVSKTDNIKQKVKPKDENNNDNNNNNSNMKIKQKGDGSTVINHCPTFNLNYPGSTFSSNP